MEAFDNKIFEQTRDCKGKEVSSFVRIDSVASIIKYLDEPNYWIASETLGIWLPIKSSFGTVVYDNGSKRKPIASGKSLVPQTPFLGVFELPENWEKNTREITFAKTLSSVACCVKFGILLKGKTEKDVLSPVHYANDKEIAEIGRQLHQLDSLSSSRDSLDNLTSQSPYGKPVFEKLGILIGHFKGDDWIAWKTTYPYHKQIKPKIYWEYSHDLSLDLGAEEPSIRNFQKPQPSWEDENRISNKKQLLTSMVDTAFGVYYSEKTKDVLGL
jgi:hypothetical protein